MKKSLLFISFMALSVISIAQNAVIKGKVKDAETGEYLIGAAVIIAGTTNGSSTDLDGNYSIKVAPGTYNLVCQFISFESDTIKGVVVTEGAEVVKDFNMGSAALSIQEFVVEAKANRAGENFMLTMQKKAVSVMDGISSQQIAKGGDSNVAGAVKRVTGISVEGGKYVYVRGLSDRYSKTTLNGAEIPGLDPNRNSVQMDLFPTSLVQNITIVKSFSPDLPGSFTGGLINVETKDFPEKFTFHYNSSIGFNTQASLNKNFLTYQGSNTDALGFDNGTRAIPNSAQEGVGERNLYGGETHVQNQELSVKTKDFLKNRFDVERKTSFLNHSHSIAVGNKKEFLGKKIGYNAGITYSKNMSFYENGQNNRYQLTSRYYETSTSLNTEEFLMDSRSEENVLWGFLGNVSVRLNDNNTITYNLIRNQNGISTTRYLEGDYPKDEEGLILQSRNLRYQQRSLFANQLKGEHELEHRKGAKLDWTLSNTVSAQETPDFRIFTNDYNVNSKGDTVYSISSNLYQDPTKFYRDMKESNTDFKINYELPFEHENGEVSKLKVGASNVYKDRRFSEKWYTFNASGDVRYNGDYDDYFSEENMNVGSANGYIYAVDATDVKNTYKGFDNVAAAYAMGDIKVTPLLRIVAGARLEQTNVTVISDKFYEETIAEEKENFKGELNNLDVLPALNATYSIADKANLRFGYTKTLARPSFRELAPFASFDIETRFVKVGNPNLERSLIDNVDLRWEWFPNIGELVSASAFYKKFENPIETFINPKAANVEVSWKNQKEATLYGLEVEFKKSLKNINKKLDGFSAGVNFTYIYARTQIDPEELAKIRAQHLNHEDTRPMFGQSPYILNTFLSYNNDSLGLTSNLTFNVSGDKMVLVVGGGTPNVYEQARPNLDFNTTKKLGDKFELKFSARNLLDATTLRYYNYMETKDYVFNQFNLGRTFSIGLKYYIK